LLAAFLPVCRSAKDSAAAVFRPSIDELISQSEETNSNPIRVISGDIRLLLKNDHNKNLARTNAQR